MYQVQYLITGPAEKMFIDGLPYMRKFVDIPVWQQYIKSRPGFVRIDIPDEAIPTEHVRAYVFETIQQATESQLVDWTSTPDYVFHDRAGLDAYEAANGITRKAKVMPVLDAPYKPVP